MSNTTEITKKYNADYYAFLSQGQEVKTKGEYLAWVVEWKAKYRELTNDIRAIKGMRKVNTYAYRAKGDDTTKRRTIVGLNNKYEERSQWIRVSMKDIANNALEARANAKVAAGKRMAEDRIAEAA